MIGDVLVVVGAAMVFVAGVGIVRLPDVFVRMQVLSKASTFGVLCVTAGGATRVTDANDFTFLVLAGLLHLVTSPVGSNLLARSTYHARSIEHRIDAADDLADDLGRV